MVPLKIFFEKLFPSREISTLLYDINCSQTCQYKNCGKLRCKNSERCLHLKARKLVSGTLRAASGHGSEPAKLARRASALDCPTWASWPRWGQRAILKPDFRAFSLFKKC